VGAQRTPGELRPCPIRKTVILALLAIIFIQNMNYAAEILAFQRKIVLDQKVEFIAYPGDFCVLEDECFVVCDVKDQRILVYDQDGKYLSSWKKFGQGPGEYQGIWLTSYKAPHLAVVDLRQPKVLLYERIGKTNFKWIKDIPESGRIIKDFVLDNGNLYFDTTIFHHNRYYFIHVRDIEGKTDEYLLPAAVRYGGRPEDNHLDIYEAKYARTWGQPKAFIDVLDGHIFSSWLGDLKVIKYDRNSNNWITFGQKTKNYYPFKLEERERIPGLGAKQLFEQNRKERTKYSWVAGVFVDKGLVGLLYLSFDKTVSSWITYLQLYDSDGVMHNEYRLPDVIPIEVYLRYFYSRETGCLYFLNMIDQEDKEVGFEVLKYKIRNRG
jgi:hypothetical protein